MTFQPIPVAAAKMLAAEYRKSIVVVVTYDPDHGQTTFTSYGRTSLEKEIASRAADAFAASLGIEKARAETYEDFHADPDALNPAALREAAELLRGLSVGEERPPTWPGKRKTF